MITDNNLDNGQDKPAVKAKKASGRTSGGEKKKKTAAKTDKEKKTVRKTVRKTAESKEDLNTLIEQAVEKTKQTRARRSTKKTADANEAAAESKPKRSRSKKSADNAAEKPAARKTTRKTAKTADKPHTQRRSRKTAPSDAAELPAVQLNAQAAQIGNIQSMHYHAVSGKKIRIIPLGGLEQIGMNITAIESENSMVIVDCGMAFPDEEMLGIDLVIPDITYLRDHADKIEGFFITHGHEDHIGALPYVLRNLNVPVFSTRLTRALIENKLREHGLIESAKLNTVKFGDFVKAGDFDVEFIKTNHSIQDAAALAIHSPAGVILHTGDFKIDYTPVFGDTIDLQRFAELGKKGVLALLCESTNATRQGFTMSERTVGHTFETIFNENKDKRIIVATFASNVDRVQQIINVAEKYDRKVVIDGRSMINVISTASELGYIKMNDNTLIDISEIKNYPDDKIVLVVTGSQGEPMAVLSRMATGQHRKLSLSENDVIVLSSTPIPGNEKAVSKVINELSRRRAKVIYQDTHVSGHACAEELKLIYTLVHPKYSIPIHGELRHRLAQKEIATAIGLPKDNCLLIDTGDVVELSSDSCRVVDKIQAGPILVDGLGIGDVGNAVLKDRQSMSQNGIIVAAVSIEHSTGELVAGPEILTRGLVYVKENEDIIDEARDVVLRVMDECRGMKDLARVRNTIRNELSDYVWRRIQRTPMILAIITEV